MWHWMQGESAMSSSQEPDASTLPTAEELQLCEAQIRDVLQTMRDRQAQGKSRSGRYVAADSARLKWINSVALPALHLGKLPSEHDMKMLRCGPLQDLQGVEHEQLQRWITRFHKDPRNQDPVKNLTPWQQTSLLEWAASNLQYVCKARPPPQGAHTAYKFGFGQYQDQTVAAMIADGNSRKLIPGAAQNAGDMLIWVCNLDGTFVWHWHKIETVRLFLGLWEAWIRSDKKLVVHGAKGPKTLDIQRLLEAYTASVGGCFRRDRPQDAPAASEPGV